MSVAALDMGLGVKPPKCRLAPTMKHTGQQLEGKLCEIFKFWLFLQSPDTRGYSPPNENSWCCHCMMLYWKCTMSDCGVEMPVVELFILFVVWTCTPDISISFSSVFGAHEYVAGWISIKYWYISPLLLLIEFTVNWPVAILFQRCRYFWSTVNKMHTRRLYWPTMTHPIPRRRQHFCDISISL